MVERVDTALNETLQDPKEF